MSVGTTIPIVSAKGATSGPADVDLAGFALQNTIGSISYFVYEIAKASSISPIRQWVGLYIAAMPSKRSRRFVSWTEIGGDSASASGPFEGFKRIMRDGYQYVETSSQYDFAVYLNKSYNFTSELQGKKLYIDMELVSDPPYYYTTAPLPVEMVTIQNHWLTDNVTVYSAILNTPSNGKIMLRLASPGSPTAMSSLNFTVIGSGLSGALKINGIYVK